MIYIGQVSDIRLDAGKGAVYFVLNNTVIKGTSVNNPTAKTYALSVDNLYTVVNNFQIDESGQTVEMLVDQLKSLILNQTVEIHVESGLDDVATNITPYALDNRLWANTGLDMPGKSHQSAFTPIPVPFLNNVGEWKGKFRFGYAIIDSPVKVLNGQSTSYVRQVPALRMDDSFKVAEGKTYETYTLSWSAQGMESINRNIVEPLEQILLYPFITAEGGPFKAYLTKNAPIPYNEFAIKSYTLNVSNGGVVTLSVQLDPLLWDFALPEKDGLTQDGKEDIATCLDDYICWPLVKLWAKSRRKSRPLQKPLNQRFFLYEPTGPQFVQLRQLLNTKPVERTTTDQQTYQTWRSLLQGEDSFTTSENVKVLTTPNSTQYLLVKVNNIDHFRKATGYNANTGEFTTRHPAVLGLVLWREYSVKAADEQGNLIPSISNYSRAVSDEFGIVKVTPNAAGTNGIDVEAFTPLGISEFFVEQEFQRLRPITPILSDTEVRLKALENMEPTIRLAQKNPQDYFALMLDFKNSQGLLEQLQISSDVDITFREPRSELLESAFTKDTNLLNNPNALLVGPDDPNIIITDITIKGSNNLSTAHLESSHLPVHQYLGRGGRIIMVQGKCKGDEALSRLKRIKEAFESSIASREASEDQQGLAYSEIQSEGMVRLAKFLKVDNEIFQMVGCSFVVPTSFEYTATSAKIYEFSFGFLDINPELQNAERLRLLNTYGQVNQVTQKWDSFYIKDNKNELHPTIYKALDYFSLQGELKYEELLPEMELPTKLELRSWIEACTKAANSWPDVNEISPSQDIQKLVSNTLGQFLDNPVFSFNKKAIQNWYKPYITGGGLFAEVDFFISHTEDPTFGAFLDEFLNYRFGAPSPTMGATSGKYQTPMMFTSKNPSVGEPVVQVLEAKDQDGSAKSAVTAPQSMIDNVYYLETGQPASDLRDRIEAAQQESIAEGKRMGWWLDTGFKPDDFQVLELEPKNLARSLPGNQPLKVLELNGKPYSVREIIDDTNIYRSDPSTNSPLVPSAVKSHIVRAQSPILASVRKEWLQKWPYIYFERTGGIEHGVALLGGETLGSIHHTPGYAGLMRVITNEEVPFSISAEVYAVGHVVFSRQSKTEPLTDNPARLQKARAFVEKHSGTKSTFSFKSIFKLYAEATGLSDNVVEDVNKWIDSDPLNLQTIPVENWVKLELDRVYETWLNAVRVNGSVYTIPGYSKDNLDVFSLVNPLLHIRSVDGNGEEQKVIFTSPGIFSPNSIITIYPTSGNDKPFRPGTTATDLTFSQNEGLTLEEQSIANLKAKYALAPSAEDSVIGMFISLRKYTPFGSLKCMFPTYQILIGNKGFFWKGAGEKLWDQYFTRTAINSIEIVESREGAAATATVTFSNVFRNLTNGRGQQLLMQRMAEEERGRWLSNIANPQNIVAEVWGRQFLKRFDKDLAKIWYRNHLNMFVLTSGARLLIRMGYGSDGTNLAPVFNGTIVQVPIDDNVVSAVAISDGNELLNPINVGTSNTTNGYVWQNKGIFGIAKSPANIVIESLVQSEGFSDLMGRSNPFFRLRDVSHGIANHGDVYVDGWWHSPTEMQVNIYDASHTTLEQQIPGFTNFFNTHATYDWGWANTNDKTWFSVSVSEPTPWKVLQTCRKAVFDFIGVSRPFALESRVFFGKWWWPCHYAYKASILQGEYQQRITNKVINNPTLNVKYQPKTETINGQLYVYHDEVYLGNVPAEVRDAIESGIAKIIVGPKLSYKDYAFSLETRKVRFYKAVQNMDEARLFDANNNIQTIAMPADQVNQVTKLTTHLLWQPFAQMYVAHTELNMFNWGVRADSKKVFTDAVALHTYSNWLGPDSIEKTITWCIDDDIIPSSRKPMVVDTGIYLTAFQGGAMNLFRGAAVRTGDFFTAGGFSKFAGRTPNTPAIQNSVISSLADSAKQMYQGWFTILGQPGLKPHDLIAVTNTKLGIKGTVVARTVIHRLDGDVGYMTFVSPDALVLSQAAAQGRHILNAIIPAATMAVGVFTARLAAKAWKNHKILHEGDILKKQAIEEVAKSRAFGSIMGGLDRDTIKATYLDQAKDAADRGTDLLIKNIDRVYQKETAVSAKEYVLNKNILPLLESANERYKEYIEELLKNNPGTPTPDPITLTLSDFLDETENFNKILEKDTILQSQIKGLDVNEILGTVQEIENSREALKESTTSLEKLREALNLKIDALDASPPTIEVNGVIEVDMIKYTAQKEELIVTYLKDFNNLIEELRNKTTALERRPLISIFLNNSDKINNLIRQIDLVLLLNNDVGQAIASIPTGGAGLFPSPKELKIFLEDNLSLSPEVIDELLENTQIEDRRGLFAALLRQQNKKIETSLKLAGIALDDFARMAGYSSWDQIYESKRLWISIFKEGTEYKTHFTSILEALRAIVKGSTGAMRVGWRTKTMVGEAMKAAYKAQSIKDPTVWKPFASALEDFTEVAAKIAKTPGVEKAYRAASFINIYKLMLDIVLATIGTTWWDAINNRLKARQCLTIYPLFIKGTPWTAGILGHAGAVVGDNPGWLDDILANAGDKLLSGEFWPTVLSVVVGLDPEALKTGGGPTDQEKAMRQALENTPGTSTTGSFEITDFNVDGKVQNGWYFNDLDTIYLAKDGQSMLGGRTWGVDALENKQLKDDQGNYLSSEIESFVTDWKNFIRNKVLVAEYESTDVYNRQVIKLFIKNWPDPGVNTRYEVFMVQNGYAFAADSTLVALEEEARRERRGMWGLSKPFERPKSFRNKK